MMKKTLVIVTGELGELRRSTSRRPRSLGECILDLFGRPGVPGGQVWGETDENGAYVTKVRSRYRTLRRLFSTSSASIIARNT